MDNRDDHELVAGCRAGDPAAYGTLIDRHYRRVFATCLGVLGHVQEAEDAAQEAVVRGFERIARLRAANQFGPWITRIAKNLCIDRLRRQRRDREAVAGRPATPPARPDEHADLQDAIRRLPMELRLPLVMYYFDGRSAAGIADTLGVSHSAICQRLRLARQELHRLLTTQGAE